VEQGLPISELDRRQLAALLAVVEDFVGDLQVSLSEAAILEMSARVAFRGTPDANGTRYFRLSTTDHLFELQNLGRHIHSVWRSRYDFGGCDEVDTGLAIRR
jgi:hypothetical protein